MDASRPLVRLVELSRAFGDTLAVDRVSLSLFGGEVLGLVGANGSGKSTLMNMLCGNLSPDSGRIELQGEPVRFEHPSHAIAQGVRMLSQSTEVYPLQSVLENIFIGQETTRSILGLRLMAWSQMRTASKSLLGGVGAEDVDPRAAAGHLSGGQKRAVALARMLAQDARILIFDEPAASLGVEQKQRLLEIIPEKASHGCSVVLISHDIDDVLAVCHRVVVLRAGQVVSDTPRGQATVERVNSEMMRVHDEHS